MTVLIAGCGALGSQIALHLAAPGRRFLLIDDDRVEEHNVGTSVYSSHHVGSQKATVLAELLWRKCGAESEVDTRTFEPGRAYLHLSLVIDTFDNVESRAILCGLAPPTLHVGVSANRLGAVVWDEDYTLPDSEYARGENPVCTHHLGAPILRLTAAVAANVVERFLETGEKCSFMVTETPGIIKI